MKRYMANLVLFFLPPTIFFPFKRVVAQWAGIKVGVNVCLSGQTQFFGKGAVEIGDDTWIGLKNTFYRTENGAIKIGKKCDIGPGVSFVAGSHQIGDANRRAGEGVGANITIEDGCWLGACVTVLGGVTIKKGSIIAAGAVVTKDVAANSLSAGCPSIFKRSLEK
jgi:maltose O-acetyltransferase